MLDFLRSLFRKENCAALQVLEKAYDQTPLEIAVYDLDRSYIFVNEQFYTAGLDPDIFVGRDDLFYISHLGVDTEVLVKREQSFKQAISEKKAVRFTEKFYFKESGKTLFFKRTYQPLFLNHSEKVSHVALFGSNLTAIVLSQNELKYLAYHDKLTGLGNRDFFNQQIEQMITESARWSEGHFSALLFCDLDNFKLVNDSLGHDAGDLLLIEVGQRIKKALRASDSIYRLGGDEFIIILKDLKLDMDAGMVAEKLIEVVSRPYSIQDQVVNYLTISIGIALYPKDGADRETLTSNADLAMYEAKKHAKNNFKYFSKELTQSSKERLKIVKGLKELVHKKDFSKQFSIMYQPIYERNSAKNFSIVGSEALLRWNHPTMGNISPNLFIPVAEESNLIQHFGEWVLQRSLQDFSQLSSQNPDNALYISINLSAKQLSTSNITAMLDTLVRKCAIPHNQVQIEITETSILDDSGSAMQNLFRLEKMGFRLAIDDFGVGFASLSYLQKIPASVIKIDRTFIQQSTADQKTQDLVKAIIALGKNLGKEVIAEGVEAQSHLDFLVENKCYKYQGFFFSKPLHLKEFQKILKKE